MAPTPTPVPLWTRLVLGLVALALLAGSGWFYREQERDVRQRAVQELSGIAELKARQIAAWRAHLLDEARELVARPLLARRIEAWLAAPSAPAPDDILAELRALQIRDDYADVQLADPTGRVLLSLTGRTVLGDGARAALIDVLQRGQPVVVDLRAGKTDPTPHLSLVAPLFSGGGSAARPLAIFVLITDAKRFLYPLVTSWPVPSTSGETYLVRRDGDAALILNDLRHRSGAALVMRVPLVDTARAAARVVLGQTGAWQGPDYRGVECLSVAIPIPASPWFLVAKVDVSEAFAAWRFRARAILGGAAGLLLLVGTFGLLFWQREQKVHYRRSYQAELSLAESQRRLATLFSNLPGMAYRCLNEPEWSMEFVSDGALELTGYGPHQLQGNREVSYGHLVHPDDVDDVWRDVQRSVADRRPFQLNYRIRTAAGQVKWVWEQGVGVFDDTNRLLALEGFIVDITERKTSSDAIHRSEERLRLALAAANQGYYDLDVRTGNAEVSPEYATMLGFDPASYRETNDAWLERMHPDDRMPVGATYRDYVAGKIPEYRVEFRQRTKSGEWTWILSLGKIVERDAQGLPLRMMGTHTDISGQKRAEESLHVQAAALEASANAIIITRSNAAIEWCNPAFTALTGYTLSEVVGQNPRILKSGHHEAAFYAGMWETLGAGHVWRGEVFNRRKDGSTYWEEMTITPVLGVQGGVTHFIAIKQDITERRRAEEERERLRSELVQAQKMESVGRLAGGVAHDFNNMLGVILGHSEMALEEVDPASTLHDAIVEIRAAARRSADLTRQLLAFARRQAAAPRVIDFNDAVAGTLKMLRRLIGEDINLAWMPGPDVWRVEIDPVQLDQVLANLGVNARDAIDGVGTVTVETSNVTFGAAYCETHPGFQPGQYAMLRVSDDGAGMSPDVQQHLFEPFFTTKATGQGTGLGLATVYGIVKQNRGFIGVDSEPGKGTTFRIYLPRAMSSAAAGADTRPAALQIAHGETLLLVEDEPSVLRLGVTMLRRLGYTVIAAGTPAEAMRLADEHPGRIDLLVTDVVMPEMNGRVLAERLLAGRPALKRLFVSGYTADVIAHHGVLDEGVFFLQKPYSMDRLAAKVREALEG